MIIRGEVVWDSGVAAYSIRMLKIVKQIQVLSGLTKSKNPMQHKINSTKVFHMFLIKLLLVEYKYRYCIFNTCDIILNSNIYI